MEENVVTSCYYISAQDIVKRSRRYRQYPWFPVHASCTTRQADYDMAHAGGHLRGPSRMRPVTESRRLIYRLGAGN